SPSPSPSQLALADDNAPATAHAAEQSVAAPRPALPIPLLVAALAVGLAAGFGAAKLTSSPAQAKTGDCSISSSVAADQKAAADALAAATDAFLAGDIATAERRAGESVSKSGTAPAYALLGKAALKNKDKLGALAAFRCALALDPMNETALDIAQRLQ
ncbi:MAG TPA: hypothetical protein VGO62_00390, partial [Myxococcota bacterium]